MVIIEIILISGFWVYVNIRKLCMFVGVYRDKIDCVLMDIIFY